ncbi:MAG: TrkA C-terminal domain-containing protein [Anaerolineales bacterium]|nr:TrkA C-terminal domain-containing protein [Anaerolineales bacterium]
MLGDRVLDLSRFTLGANSKLIGGSVQSAEHELDLSVVLLKRGKDADLHPDDARRFQAGDEVTVFADTATLQRFRRLADGA